MSASVLPPQWDRPASAEALALARQAASQAEQAFQRCQAQSRAAFQNLLGSVWAWLLSLGILIWVAWGLPPPHDPHAKIPLSLVGLVGVGVLVNLLALGSALFYLRKGPVAHAKALELEPQARQASKLASVTPTADQIEHWRQVPTVAEQAQAWAAGPLGLLAEDVVQLDAAIQAHRAAEAHRTVDAFLHPASAHGR